MGEFRQCVHFTASFDGVRLAYGISGRGHPLVRVPTWISHVEHDWQSPVMRHLVVEMASRHKLVNYDCRGVGMSQRDAPDMSFDAWVHDLEAVADAAGLKRPHTRELTANQQRFPTSPQAPGWAEGRNPRRCISARSPRTRRSARSSRPRAGW